MSKRRRTAAPGSPDIRNGHFASKLNNVTGRAVRKCRTHEARDSPFEDSAIAISDSDNDDDVDEKDHGDVIAVAPRKRKRSPSPEDPLQNDEPYESELSELDSELDHLEASTLASTLVSPAPPTSAHMTFNLTVIVPVGHQGPLTLHLDPKQFSASANPTPPTFPTAPAPRGMATRSKVPRPDPAPLTKTNKSKRTAGSKEKSNTEGRPKEEVKTYAGFMDIPGELRNEIYRMVLTSENPVNFSQPDNFSRSGQLLRTCRDVYEEGRSILYSENQFIVERRTCRYGSLWKKEWRELGYYTVRKFFKSIGPNNVALIRNISFMLEDAVPCLNPNLATNEERRFVNDDDLMSVLRRLADYSDLKTLKIHFHGRRRVERTDDRFLSYLKRIKADQVTFESWPPGGQYNRDSKQEYAVQNMLISCCTRKRKRFPA